MKSLRHRLPPANALVVFEAVARQLGFTAAARELGVSQAAVSRQIRNLESHLGLALFRRDRRRVFLTEAGEQLRQAVDLGLNHIANTADALRGTTGSGGALTVATSIAFSSFWLMPRLVRFHAAHPGRALNLVTTDGASDWAAEQVSLAVVFDREDRAGNDWSGYECHRLFGDEILAVAHPEYFAARPWPERPEALLGESLLHQRGGQTYWSDWASWFERCGVSPPASLPGPRFTTYTITIQAALDGQGIALGWRRMLAPQLRSGQLRPVTAARVVPEEGYHALVPEAAKRDPETGIFRDWLLAEAAADWR